MRRILSLWLPTYATDLLLPEQNSNFCRTQLAATPPAVTGGRPAALIEQRGNVLRLHAVNAAARAAGLRPEQLLAEARALCPGLITAEVDALLLQRASRWLAGWLDRFSPLVAASALARAEATACQGGLLPPAAGPGDDRLAALGQCSGGDAGFWLDITGVSHLFGGEAALQQRLVDGLARLGLSAQSAVADSAGCAWAVCRFSPAHANPQSVPSGGQAAALARLPLAALRLDGKTVEALSRVGLQRIEQLATLSRASLARRFGPALLFRLDQAYGRAQEALQPLQPQDSFERRVAFADPVSQEAPLKAALDQALLPLLQALAEQDLGLRCLRLKLFRSDGSCKTLEVRTHAPSREAAALRRLLADRWQEIDPRFGIDLLALSAPTVQPLRREQNALFSATAAMGSAPRRGTGPKPSAVLPARSIAAAPPALLPLFDRISNRLGGRVVQRMTAQARYQPEAAFRALPPADTPPRPAPASTPARPLHLVIPPEPVEPAQLALHSRDGHQDLTLRAFTWRRVTRPVARVEGPERIAAPWWLESPADRASDRGALAAGEPAGSRDRLDARALAARDYYRVTCTQGQQYWLFQDQQQPSAGRWFLHGQFQ